MRYEIVWAHSYTRNEFIRGEREDTSDLPDRNSAGNTKSRAIHRFARYSRYTAAVYREKRGERGDREYKGTKATGSLSEIAKACKWMSCPFVPKGEKIITRWEMYFMESLSVHSVF